MLNVGDPDSAFALSVLPNDGVGLARLEFIINNHIGVHPMALVRYPHLAREEDVRRSAAGAWPTRPRRRRYSRSSRRRHSAADKFRS